MADRVVIDGARDVQSGAWLALASLPLVAAGALLVAWLLTQTPFAVFGIHLLVLGAVAQTWVRRSRPGRAWEAARIEAGASGLRVGGEVVPRADVKDAFVVPQPDRMPIVRVARRRGADLDLRIPDEEQARALLLALGQDVSQRTARFRGASLALSGWMRFLPVAFAAPLVFLMPLAKAAAPVIPLVLVPLLALLYLWPSQLVVGADGVLVRWLFTRRFLPTRDIVDARTYEESLGRNRTRGVEIVMRDGKNMRVPVSSPAWDGGRTDLMAERIRAAVALARSGEAAAEHALVLGREGAAAGEWVSRLRALGTGANAQLRVAPIDPERLWRVVEDPAQPFVERAAAAVALGPTLEGEGKQRLARVAETVAKPELRVALEAVGEDADDARLEEALGELERG